jgi:hypothetical protein
MEKNRCELENDYLNQIFRGSISILRGIMELRALGLAEDEAKSLAYRQPDWVLRGRPRGKQGKRVPAGDTGWQSSPSFFVKKIPPMSGE